MSDTPWFTYDDTAGPPRLRLAGAWRLANLPAIEAALATSRSAPAAWPRALQVDGSRLEALDSAGALLLLQSLERAGADAPRWEALEPGAARILDQVRQHRHARAPSPARPRSWLARALGDVGEKAMGMAELARGHMAFLGQTTLALAELLRWPRRLRIRELTVQLDQAGLAAIPVVSLVTLLIGIVVTYLLGLQAGKYGANIFVVDGVGIGATREFAPIIVAVIIAGRSGASFTAQLGSMRLTEETDAIRTLGLSPMQVLVMPRVLALVIALPLLVFVGDVMSLLGAMAIAGPMLDITPSAFLARLRESLDLRHPMVGLLKAPAFAIAIALIGARMGMGVARDTRALGEATTSTVVQSIVAVILLDALFAVVLQAVGL